MRERRPERFNALPQRKPTAGALHRHLEQVQPYRVLGQYDQPVAPRSNVTGLLASPVIVYWNIDKN